MNSKMHADIWRLYWSTGYTEIMIFNQQSPKFLPQGFLTMWHAEASATASCGQRQEGWNKEP